MQLPFLLAGPIVRRARPDQVLIWVAVSDDVHLGAELYKAKKQGEGYEIDKAYPIGEGTSGMRLWRGAGMWIHLIEILPNDRAKDGVFPSREILAYDLLGRTHPLRPIRTTSSEVRMPSRTRVATPERRKQLLKQRPPVMSSRIESNGQHLKSWPGVSIQDFCLPGFDLPTLVLQDPGRNDLVAFYGSCRKLHGEGNDAARLLERRLNRVAASPDLRPNALFLTGDQIYADDVHDELIGFITSFGDLAVNGLEPLPDAPDRMDKPKQRAKVAKDVAKFKSGYAANHAFRFTDFAMLYLLAWNPRMWPSTVKDSNLLEGKKGSEAMRRVLANIPTYMGFDDHEVTDDWNLNAPLRAAIAKSRLGTRVTANALAAYLDFQALGNNPEAFSEALTVDLMEERMDAPGIDGKLDLAWDKELIGFSNWQFATPTMPKALFLDSRTQRGVSSAKEDWMWTAVRDPFGTAVAKKVRKERHNEPALLMNSSVMQNAVHAVVKVRDQPLVLIAPAPVLQIERVEDLAAASNWLEGPYERDFEGWHANHESFIRLFTDLVGPLNPKSCVILSGDVHFAQATSATIETRSGAIPVMQLTSSALKNKVTFDPFFDVVKMGRKQVRRRLWWLLPSGEVVWLDAEFGVKAESDKETDLTTEFGVPDVIEASQSLDLQIGQQGNLLQYSNIGVLTVRGGVESMFFALESDKEYASTTFKL